MHEVPSLTHIPTKINVKIYYTLRIPASLSLAFSTMSSVFSNGPEMHACEKRRKTALPNPSLPVDAQLHLWKRAGRFSTKCPHQSKEHGYQWGHAKNLPMRFFLSYSGVVFLSSHQHKQALPLSHYTHLFNRLRYLYFVWHLTLCFNCSD